MAFKKIVLVSLLICLITATTNGLPYPEMRSQGLIYAGLILTLGGTYQLAKRSESHLFRVIDTVGGLIFLAAGITLLTLSSQLITELDQSFK